MSHCHIISESDVLYEKVDEDLNLCILKHVVKAMEYIHSKDLIHRDLKVKSINYHVTFLKYNVGG